MQIENAIYPTSEQINRLTNDATSRPIIMVNLLKFRDKAKYKDETASDVSGTAAYDRYATEFKTVLNQVGGRILFWGEVKSLTIGSADQLWDAVVLVEYPSSEVFASIISSPDLRSITVHRKAALEGQLLIETVARQ